MVGIHGIVHDSVDCEASLLRWCKTLGVPEVWVGDTASHFKNRVMKKLEGVLRIEHIFAVANPP